MSPARLLRRFRRWRAYRKAVPLTSELIEEFTQPDGGIRFPKGVYRVPSGFRFPHSVSGAGMGETVLFQERDHGQRP